jgi:hypothetical protein
MMMMIVMMLNYIIYNVLNDILDIGVTCEALKNMLRMYTLRMYTLTYAHADVYCKDGNRNRDL